MPKFRAEQHLPPERWNDLQRQAGRGFGDGGEQQHVIRRVGPTTQLSCPESRPDRDDEAVS